MAITTTYTNNQDDTSTITIKVTADTNKILLLSPEASEYYYPQHVIFENDLPVLWDDLTNAQKLVVLGKEAIKHLKEGAYQQYFNREDDEFRSGLDDIDSRY